MMKKFIQEEFKKITSFKNCNKDKQDAKIRKIQENFSFKKTIMKKNENKDNNTNNSKKNNTDYKNS